MLSLLLNAFSMLFQCFFNAWRRHFDAWRLHLAPCFFGLRRFFPISNAFFCANELEICCFDHCIIRVSENLSTLTKYRPKTMRKSWISSRSTSFEMTFRILVCQRLLFTDITASGSGSFLPFLNRIFGRNFIDVSTSVLAKIYFFHIQSLVLTRGAESPRKSVVDPQKIVKIRAFWLELWAF